MGHRHNYWIDIPAISATVGASMNWLPEHIGQLAAGAAVIYYIMLGITWVANKGWKARR